MELVTTGNVVQQDGKRSLEDWQRLVRLVEVTTYFAPTEFLLGAVDLDVLARTFGRTILRQMMPRITDEQVRERVEEFIDRG